MNILLVDDHPLFGVGFAHALMTVAPDLQVQTAPSLPLGLALALAAQAAERTGLDIVLVDYHLGAHSGIEGLRCFGQQHPKVPRILISGDETPNLMAAARAAGASGFLGKSQPLERMLAALRLVVKILTGAGRPLTGRLMLYDGLNGTARAVTVAADPACPVCGRA